MNNYRKLLVLAVNELLTKRLISLDAPGTEGFLHTVIAGEPSVITWQEITGDELRVSVWWKYDHTRHPQANLTGSHRESFTGSHPLANRIHYPKFVGACASAWLERRTGKYLQGMGSKGIFDTYTRRTEVATLEALADAVPNGFKPEGRFFA